MLRGELFSTDMVRAYLEGRKKHTCRPIKGLPDSGFVSLDENPEVCFDGDPESVKTLDGLYATFETYGDYAVNFPMSKAKHRPGDYIYCRETWNGMCLDCQDCTREGYLYKADGTFGLCCPYELKWVPSIHMPREAARLFFRVARVEAMALEDVTEEFAREDGFTDHDGNSALVWFHVFWQATYGPDARWMWVYWTEACTREEAMGRDEM